ncbi:SsgA family sporulation/cell division regulator [Amycolatopsis japonica]|uniref:SsgA family sporulation/cell division regulator n=1 Tax=Amycolatopsis japonica TaxID=208439 RepID=UPI003672B77D
MLPTSTAVSFGAEVMAMDLEQVMGTSAANLIYRTADPWAVTLEVRSGVRSWVSWVFARCLLSDALVGRSPDGNVGDVVVTVAGSHVLLELSSPSGHAFLRLRRADVERLLDKAEQLVPEGSESLDWDREMAWLAGEDA